MEGTINFRNSCFFVARVLHPAICAVPHSVYIPKTRMQAAEFLVYGAQIGERGVYRGYPDWRCWPL